MGLWDLALGLSSIAAVLLWYIQPRYYVVRRSHRTWRRLSGAIVGVSLAWAVFVQFTTAPLWLILPRAAALLVTFLAPEWIVRVAYRIDARGRDTST
jgi:uncharacterized membrane protein HdeD (DUF308 family)